MFNSTAKYEKIKLQKNACFDYILVGIAFCKYIYVVESGIIEIYAYNMGISVTTEFKFQAQIFLEIREKIVMITFTCVTNR